MPFPLSFFLSRILLVSFDGPSDAIVGHTVNSFRDRQLKPFSPVEPREASCLSFFNLRHQTAEATF